MCKNILVVGADYQGENFENSSMFPQIQGEVYSGARTIYRANKKLEKKEYCAVILDGVSHPYKFKEDSSEKYSLSFLKTCQEKGIGRIIFAEKEEVTKNIVALSDRIIYKEYPKSQKQTELLSAIKNFIS